MEQADTEPWGWTSLTWPDCFFRFSLWWQKKGLDLFTGHTRLNTTPWHG